MKLPILRFLKIVFLLFFFSVLLIRPLRGQDEIAATKEQNPGFFQGLSVQFLQNFNFYQNLASYIQQERSGLLSRELKSSNLTLQETLFLSSLDLILSGICLWLAMLLLFKINKFDLKVYLWFIFAFNFSWFVVLMFFKWIWKLLNSVVISQQADLETVILDKFCATLMVIAVIVFVWLLARVFRLHFLGALETFFTLHIFYFVILLVFSQVLIDSKDKSIKLALTNLGVRPIIHACFLEINKITYGNSDQPLDRIKVYHL